MVTSSEFINLIKEKKYDEIRKLANNNREEFHNLCDNINTRNYFANCDNCEVFELLNECKYSFTSQSNKSSGTQPLFITICKNDNISFKTFEKILNFIPEQEKQTMFQIIPNLEGLNSEYPLNSLIRSALFLPKNTENYEEKQKCFINKIKLLVKQGANIEAIDNARTQGASAFILLISNPYIDVDYITSLIQDNKKILKKKDKHNETVLHKCATSANLEVIKLLIEKGLDITAEGANKTTPLMLLCKNKDITVDFLEYLFKKYHKTTKNINKTNTSNKNALHYAADGCNIEIMNFLAQKGVDATTIMSEGTPLMILIKNIKEKKVEITDDFISKFEKLVENKNIQESINILNDDKQNVLHEILKTGNNVGITKIIKILIKNGANIKQENTQGVTPFMLLCKRNDIDAQYLEELINKNNITKNDINKIDDFGNSILSAIVQNVNKDKLNILKLLIDNGADINLKSKNGKSVLDIVKEKNDAELIEFFESVKNNLQNSNNTTQNNSPKTTNNTPIKNILQQKPKPATETTATSCIPKMQADMSTEEQHKTNITKNIYNDIKQENIDIHKQQEVTTQDTQKEKQDNIQITNKEENDNKTKESGSQNATETNITNNTVQTSESALQNNNKDDIMLMFCLMFVMLNIKNKYLNNTMGCSVSFFR